MQKKQFFSHDENALNDPKIMSMMSVYGFEGYGWFWAIVESLRRSDKFEICFTSKNFIGGLAYLLRTDSNKAKQFLNDCIEEFELFESDGINFWSNSLKERMQIMDDKKIKNRESAMKRWDKEREKHSTVVQESILEENKEEHISVKEKRVKTKNATIAQYSEDVEYLTDLLINKIEQNNSNAKKPSNIDSWKKEIQSMIEIDKYTFAQVSRMIEFSQHDDFWKSNILSSKKLREKAGTLILQMQRKKNVVKDESPTEMYERLLKYVNGDDEDNEQKRNFEIVDVDSIVL